MKISSKKLKCIMCFFMSLIVFMGLVLLFNINNNEGDLKGKITVWADEGSYDYLNTIAQEIMISNSKCNIKILKVSKDEYVNRIEEAIISGDLPSVLKLDNESINQITKEFGERINIRDNRQFIDNNSNNFTQRRIQEVTIDNNIIAIPFTSKPIVLYLREDLLIEYGYTYENINTWEELINMGKDVYNKSEGKIKILNGTGKDYEYMVSLLIMQAMEETIDEKVIRNKIKEDIEVLKSENILNLDPNGSYLARISSVEGMQEIRKINVKCKWTTNNAPSKSFGSNRFYMVEGENLVILDKGGNNEKALVEKYIEAVSKNTKGVLNCINDDNLFLSYLYAYKSKEIEREVTHFINKSPLIIMSNIMEKAPSLKDYNIYVKVKDDLLN